MDKATYYRQFEHFQQNREKHFAKKILNALKAQTQQFLQTQDLMSVTSAPIQIVLKEIYLDSRHYGSLVYSQLPKAKKTQKRRAPGSNNLESPTKK